MKRGFSPWGVLSGMLAPMEVFSVSLIDLDYDARLSLAKYLGKTIALEIPPIYEGFDFSTLWTVAIRNVLRTLMPKSWRMLPPTDESSAGEFLVDACWWVNSVGAALVAEFEWDSSWKEIVKDFEKLLVIKSPLKLMIFASSKGASSSLKIEEELKGYLSQYDHHIAGETYIFIEYWPHERVRAFIWQARSAGRVQVDFEEHLKLQRFDRKWRRPITLEP
jgi:hypothetical protein